METFRRGSSAARWGWGRKPYRENTSKGMEARASLLYLENGMPGVCKGWTVKHGGSRGRPIGRWKP